MMHPSFLNFISLRMNTTYRLLNKTSKVIKKSCRHLFVKFLVIITIAIFLLSRCRIFFCFEKQVFFVPLIQLISASSMVLLLGVGVTLYFCSRMSEMRLYHCAVHCRFHVRVIYTRKQHFIKSVEEIKAYFSRHRLNSPSLLFHKQLTSRCFS